MSDTPSIEFFSQPRKRPAPEPQEQPAEAAQSPAEAPAEPVVEAESKTLEKAVLEVDVPQTKGVAEPTKAEIQMTKRATADPGDPSVLLQGMLGNLPGVDGTRAAGMALNADVALHNLGVKARRQIDLARRAERAAKPKKQRRRR